MKPKQLHWTQRPGGKEKLAAAVRKGNKAKAAKRTTTDSTLTQGDPDVPPFHAGYLFGKTEALIETTAQQLRLSAAALADGLGKLLQHRARRP